MPGLHAPPPSEACCSFGALFPSLGGVAEISQDPLFLCIWLRRGKALGPFIPGAKSSSPGSRAATGVRRILESSSAHPAPPMDTDRTALQGSSSRPGSVNCESCRAGLAQDFLLPASVCPMGGLTQCQWFWGWLEQGLWLLLSIQQMMT